MEYYTVIDTNVLVAALLTKKEDAATVKVLEANIEKLLSFVKQSGVKILPRPTGEILIDMDDLIFYEVFMEMSSKSTFLVTGNLRHYPTKRRIITPSQMIEILNHAEDS